MCNHNHLIISDKCFVKCKVCTQKQCGTVQKASFGTAKHGFLQRNMPQAASPYAVKKAGTHALPVCELTPCTRQQTPFGMIKGSCQPPKELFATRYTDIPEVTFCNNKNRRRQHYDTLLHIHKRLRLKKLAILNLPIFSWGCIKMGKNIHCRDIIHYVRTL